MSYSSKTEPSSNSVIMPCKAFVKKMDISLTENPSWSGNAVRGKVVLDVEGLLKIQCLRITAVRFCRKSMHTDPVECLRKRAIVLGSETNADLHRTVTPGQHQYRFTFPLPLSCPSSYEGRGYIRYWLVAELAAVDKNLKHITRTALFSVKAQVDVGLPEYRVPLEVSDELNISWLHWNCAPVRLTIRTDKRGYCSGDTILHSGTVINRTAKGISVIIRILKMEISTGRAYTVDIYRRRRFGSIPPHDTVSWSCEEVVIPEARPSINNCSTLSLEYCLEVTLWSLSMNKKHTSVRLPFTMGTLIPTLADTVPVSYPLRAIALPGRTNDRADSTGSLNCPPTSSGPPAYHELVMGISTEEPPPTYAHLLGLVDPAEDQPPRYTLEPVRK